MEQVIVARGHPAVQATHRSTLEVTTDEHLTAAGDCIVAVAADRAPSAFDPRFVAACRDASATVRATIATGGHEQVITGRGDPALPFDSDRAAVLRTSTHVDGRTVMLGADAAAGDLDRDLVSELGEGAPVRVTLSVDP